MSLRSIEKFIKEDVRVVVVSERMPPYLSDEVAYAECCSYLNALEVATTLDTEFLWMNDDIILLRDWTWDQLKSWRRGASQVSESRQEGMITGGGAWARRKGLVLKQLREEGKSTFDYSTHTPYFYKSDELRDILSRFSYGYKTPVETAYGNSVDVDIAFTGGVLSRHSEKFLPVDVSSYGLLNFDDTGFTDHMKGFLLGMFPTPSRFEDLGTCNLATTLLNQIK